MIESADGSQDYNLQLGRLQEAFLRQAITAADYERLKQDLIHPATVVLDPLYRYNCAVARLQKAMLKGRIDRDAYAKLLGDLIRPEGAASGRGDGAAKGATPTPSPPPAAAKPSAAPAAPAHAAEARDKFANPRATLRAATLEDLIERHDQPGTHDLIANHAEIGENVHLLKRKVEELERKGEYSPNDIKTISFFDELMVRLRAQKKA